jgi:hypothetical protein
MQLKVIKYNQAVGIFANILICLECLLKKNKNEILYFEFNNIHYSNKFNVWEKFLHQPFQEYEDLIAKKIKEKNYQIENNQRYGGLKFDHTNNKKLDIYYNKKYINTLRKVFKKFIIFKKKIIDRSDKFEKKHLNNKTLGVHIRGGDRFHGQGHYSDKRHLFTFEDDIKPKVAQKIKINKYKNIFLATDEKFFYDELKKNFKKNNIKFNSAINKKNVSHWDQVYSNEKNKTILGEDAIIDSIILSKCDYSLLSRSNLSVTSILLRDDYNFSFLDEHLL